LPAQIPFNISKEEIRQFLKRNFFFHDTNAAGAKVEHAVAVHIIMERTTAKTEDCYVELSGEEAESVMWNRYAGLLSEFSVPKLNNRHITLEKSSQEELMKQIFPRAHCIDWNNEYGIPVKVRNFDWYSAGFSGFLTQEELNMLVRHTLEPDRVSGALKNVPTQLNFVQSPYSGRCMQRSFETMMSMLEKV
jgi:hypothetical protein